MRKLSEKSVSSFLCAKKIPSSTFGAGIVANCHCVHVSHLCAHTWKRPAAQFVGLYDTPPPFPQQTEPQSPVGRAEPVTPITRDGHKNRSNFWGGGGGGGICHSR